MISAEYSSPTNTINKNSPPEHHSILASPNSADHSQPPIKPISIGPSKQAPRSASSVLDKLAGSFSKLITSNSSPNTSNHPTLPHTTPDLPPTPLPFSSFKLPPQPLPISSPAPTTRPYAHNHTHFQSLAPITASLKIDPSHPNPIRHSASPSELSSARSRSDTETLSQTTDSQASSSDSTDLTSAEELSSAGSWVDPQPLHSALPNLPHKPCPAPESCHLSSLEASHPQAPLPTTPSSASSHSPMQVLCPSRPLSARSFAPSGVVGLASPCTPPFHSALISIAASPGLPHSPALPSKPILHLDPNVRSSSLSSNSLAVVGGGDATPTQLISPAGLAVSQQFSPSDTVTMDDSRFKVKASRRLSVLNSLSHWESSPHKQRWSSGSAISPKDAIAIDCVSPGRLNPLASPRTPALVPSGLPSHLSNSSAGQSYLDHRRTLSGPSHLVPSQLGTSKRVSWNPNGLGSASKSRHSWNLNPVSPAAPSGLPPTPPALTEEEIKNIEQLGVKFVERSGSGPEGAPAAALLLRSGSSGSSPGRAVRRNSVVTSKRRKSLKLHLPSHNIQQSETGAGPQVMSNRQGAEGLEPVGIDGNTLIELMARSGKGKGKENEPPLLVIDLRSLSSYLGPNGRLKGSINVNFPSLLIKRFRKGSHGNFQLSSFITTEAGKRYYSKLEKSYKANTNSSSSVLDQLDICVIDDQLVQDDHMGQGKTEAGIGRVLLDVLSKLLTERRRTAGLYFLNEEFQTVARGEKAQKWLLLGEQERPEELSAHDGSRPGDGVARDGAQSQAGTPGGAQPSGTQTPVGPQGLLRLRPSGPVRSLPCIDQDSSRRPSPVDVTPSTASSPGPAMKPSKQRRLEAPSNGLLGCPSRSRESLRAKQSLTQIKTDCQTLSGTSSRLQTASSRSSTALVGRLVLPERSSLRMSTGAASAVSSGSQPFSSQHSNGQQMGGQPSSAVVNMGEHRFSSPSPVYDLPTATGTQNCISPGPTTHPEITFKISTIIPSFLYLGPEPSKESDFEELRKSGVKRVLNLALECTDEEEMIKEKGHDGWIEKYVWLPLRDFVEEVGVQRRIDEANLVLDDASLHSSPIYVHCKAGKSRSVTIVLAYLIHRYRWSLRQSYAHVSERRKGICPNIGFLAELMSFEERELGSKSHGVVGPPCPTATRSMSHDPSSISGLYGQAEDGGALSAGSRDALERYSLGKPGGTERRLPASVQHIKHHGFRVRSVALSKQDISGVTNSNGSSRPRERDSLPAGFGRQEIGMDCAASGGGGGSNCVEKEVEMGI